MSKGKCFKSCTTLCGSQTHSGLRLRALLDEYFIGPSAFAGFLGVSPQCLANWFIRGVPRSRAEKLAQLLSVSVVWLLEGEGARAHVVLVSSTTLINASEKPCKVDE